MSIVLGDGQRHHIGDANEPFSIQSISKVFTLSMALRQVGEDLWQRVGREPSGSAFNSIVQLERELGLPRLGHDDSPRRDLAARGHGD